MTHTSAVTRNSSIIHTKPTTRTLVLECLLSLSQHTTSSLGRLNVSVALIYAFISLPFPYLSEAKLTHWHFRGGLVQMAPHDIYGDVCICWVLTTAASSLPTPAKQSHMLCALCVLIQSYIAASFNNEIQQNRIMRSYELLFGPTAVGSGPNAFVIIDLKVRVQWIIHSIQCAWNVD